MRSLYLLFLVLVTSFSATAQSWMESFEAPNDAYRSNFVIDTSYHNNQWQIGKPAKTIFDSAYSLSNALVTDTSHHCFPNDTSVFILYNRPYFFSGFHSISFKYKLDIDTGTIAKVELSGDNGINWINPLTQDTTYMFSWSTKPRLDTSAHSWQSFNLDLAPWISASPGGSLSFPHYRTSDTIIFRFTFITDSDTTAQDGWMLDNFYLQNYVMEGGVKLEEKDNLLSVYPIPSTGPLYLSITEPASDNASVVIYNIKGQPVYADEHVPASVILNPQLPNGNYVLKYTSGQGYALKRITILK